MGKQNGKVEGNGSIRVAGSDEGVIRRLSARTALYARSGAQMAREAPLGRDWRSVSRRDESLDGGSSAVSGGRTGNAVHSSRRKLLKRVLIQVALTTFPRFPVERDMP